MSTQTTLSLEERVAALEVEVSRLRFKAAQASGAVMGRTAPDFLDRVFGILADDPTFDEAVRLGQEWRYADRDWTE